ncbi:MAG: UDP-N-acetylmuramate--L-alanine ligase [Dehalococcoidia bacterium]|nr:UDP-N-acetylmuramate--L-alanine ligase [Dehalococcoidia bacterium]
MKNEFIDLPKNIFFLGIGGIHMSAIAKLLFMRGYQVSGSDLSHSSTISHLEKIGIKVFIGHNAVNIKDAELIVYTSAINPNNPELVQAKQSQVPIISRAQIINFLVQDKKLVAIGGSHGKTTITTLISYFLLKMELEPLVFSGGLSKDISKSIETKIEKKFLRMEENVYDGMGKLAIIEADEYKEAYLSYHPNIILINNVDIDHIDYFVSEDAITESFLDFANSIERNGTVFLNKDSHNASIIGASIEKKNIKTEYYSIDKRSDWQAKKITGNKDGTTSFELFWKGKKIESLTTKLSGRHNILNITGSIAIAMKLGIGFQEIKSMLLDFEGINRRFSIYKHPQNIILIDDYAHHPAEIKVTIATAKTKFPRRKIIGCFQPHTYSRSQYLLSKFQDCFEFLDELIILPTFAARETPEQGIDSIQLSKSIKLARCTYIDSFEMAIKRITDNIEAGDIILTLGAGNISEIVPIINQKIEKNFYE